MKGKIKFFCLSVLLTALPLLSGCWDSKELNTMAIVTGIGLDAVPDSNEIELTLQIAQISASSGKGGGSSGENSSFITMSAKNENVILALENLREDSPRWLFFEQNQIIVFGSELAKKCICPVLDTFVRSHSTRMEVWVLVAEKTAKELLTTPLDTNIITSQSISDIIADRSNVSNILGTRMVDLVSEIVTPSSSITLPVVGVKKEDEKGEKGRLSFGELAILKKERMIDLLDHSKGIGYIWTNGQINGGIIHIKTQEGEAILATTRGISRFEPILYTDGRIEMNVDVHGIFSISEMYGFEKETPKTIEPTLNKEAEKEIEKLIRSCFSTAQASSADIYDLGVAIHRKYPEQWKDMEKNWEALFPTVELSVKVHSTIVDDGRITLPLGSKDGGSHADDK